MPIALSTKACPMVSPVVLSKRSRSRPASIAIALLSGAGSTVGRKPSSS